MSGTVRRYRPPIIDLPGEEWREVPGFPGYAVSNMGRAKSLARTLRRKHPKTGEEGFGFQYVEKLLRPVLRAQGYRMVNLSGAQIFLHRAVLLAFVGPCPEGFEGCHGNGDSADNRLANLRWDTKAGNMADRERHGRTPHGETHPTAKFPSALVKAIRAGEVSLAEARAAGMAQTHYYRIRKGEVRVRD
jgi:hypothetical protein